VLPLEGESDPSCPASQSPQLAQAVAEAPMHIATATIAAAHRSRLRMRIAMLQQTSPKATARIAGKIEKALI
jgi:hypothetical protein